MAISINIEHRTGRGRLRGPAQPLRRRRSAISTALAFWISLTAAACAPIAQNESDQTNEAAGRSTATGSMLLRSDPAEGARVSGAATLSLTFREPVRLVEVIVAGPSGEMPMMVEAAGEQSAYSIPLPDLEPGRQEVRWRALDRNGTSLSGRLSFTVL